MSDAVFAALVSLAGVFLSGLVSFFVARHSSRWEIKKMKLEWLRQDKTGFDETCANMVLAVESFFAKLDTSSYHSAVAAIAAVRARSSGPLAADLDALQSAIAVPWDIPQAQKHLSAALKHKRNQRCKQK